MNSNTENSDEYQYGWVMFRVQTIKFVIRAIDFYLSLLGEEERELAGDPELSALLNDDARQELGLESERQRATRIKTWFSEKIQGRELYDTADLTVSHWLVRYMKSLAFLYLKSLKQRRNKFAGRKAVTSFTLSAVDREISVIEELFKNSGVFKNASTLELLASYADSSELPTRPASPPLELVERPRPVLVSSIDILDHELRARCLDLFNQFQESGQSDRNDTVVAEASRILENRLRRVLGADNGTSAKQLVSQAFNNKSPRLVVSNVQSEQDSAQLLFLGTFGFIRNSVQHKLLENMAAERVLQILGWTDYLLSVIDQSQTQTSPSEQLDS
ncbi:TIGR02391 family protein [Xanthomonas vasicola]|uniref:TIGR02391 family protein n=1 Tax=Xanthomonas TaxID=338 RepID=UPI0005311EFE|nr:TIGR02391 family protein [Xanthomonas vasicola]AZR36563.1 hypothetical protein NX08_021175 [Xanthomonas vasicola]KGR51915.1 hypothetical protein NX07_12555 [Xanthomonas vasicola]KGT85525.1 hypothetical protein OC00_02375 [Xanthomonas vasicola]